MQPADKVGLANTRLTGDRHQHGAAIASVSHEGRQQIRLGGGSLDRAIGRPRDKRSGFMNRQQHRVVDDLGLGPDALGDVLWTGPEVTE